MKSKLLLSLLLVTLAASAVFAQPTIASFSPAVGPPGTLVTINGTNLGSPATFTIGGRAAIVVSNNGSKLVGYVMPNAATGPIAITTAGGTASSSTNFRITATSYPSQQKGNPIITATNYGRAEIGTSVAISADGTTAIVGGPDYYTGSGINPGVALVFVYSGGMWTQQAEFSASNFSPGQGSSVALSADGNTAMVGGSADDSTSVDNTTIGAVWFYARVGTVWTEEGKPLIGNGYIPYPDQGYSCALSADGNTAIAGGPGDNGEIGAAWIYTRSNGTWTQQGPKLVPSDNTGNANFGNSVAISADGNTAVMGGYGDNTGINAQHEQTVAGATWIFTRTGSTWSQQGGKLVATGGNGEDRQGTAVGVSADGNTMVTSGPGSNSVWIFTRNGTTWSQLGSALPETGVTGNPGNGIQAGFGSGVAISADGNTVVVGDSQNGSFDGPGPGGTWVFTRSGNTYVQQEGALMGTGTGTTQYPSQGAAVALTANGTAFITGGPPNGTNFQGGAWVFAADANANLTNLKLNSGSLTPAFATGTTVYTAAVVNGVTSMTVTPTTSDPKATVLVNNTAVTSGTASGAIPLTVGTNAISVLVIAPDGVTVQTYTITVTRAPSTVAALAGLTISHGTLSPAFATPTTSYTNAVGNAVTSLTVKSTAAGSGATITVNGMAATSGAASQSIPIAEGSNAITIVVTAQDGVTKKTYTITVTRAPSSVAALAGLGISSGVLSPAFATPATSYSVSEATTVSAVTVKPTAAGVGASITVNGSTVTSGTSSQSIALAPGANTITVVVTAQDGVTKKTYTLTVTQVLSNVATLSMLAVSSSALNPAFSANITSYTAADANTVSAVVVKPTAAGLDAAITVNGTAISSGTLSQSIPLSVGPNTITIAVTAQDGVTKKTYTVTVTRSASSVAALAALSITGGTLSPTFATPTTSYTAAVTNYVTSLTVKPTAVAAGSTITVNGTAVASGSASAGIPLTVGPNANNITVTAPDGVTQKTYTVTVTRAPSTVAALAGLGINSGALSPTFATHTSSYTVAEDNSVASVTLKPTAAGVGASIMVNGKAVTSGTQSQSIPLAVGDNDVSVVVTAQDGVTNTTYTVTITRAAAGVDGYDPGISVTKPTETPVLADDGILVHQSLSPNGDGINDFLQIDNIAQYPDNKLSIMNRNGQLVYEAKGYDNNSKVFDGHSNKNRQMQLPGTYFYQLDYTVNGITKRKTGFLVLKY